MRAGHLHAVNIATRHRSPRLGVRCGNVEENSGTFVAQIAHLMHRTVIEILPGECEDAALGQLREAVLQCMQLAVVSLHYGCSILGGAHRLVAQCFQCMHLFGICLGIFMIEFRNVLSGRERERAKQRVNDLLFILQLPVLIRHQLRRQLR